MQFFEHFCWITDGREYQRRVTPAYENQKNCNLKIMEINPLSIILVKSDSKGDRMLFRYPHTTNHQRDANQYQKKKNPYSIIIAEDSLQVCLFY